MIEKPMFSVRFLTAVLLVASLPVFAAIDVYEFSTEQERSRYAQFIEELRCPKCKNNNLAGTNSKIAVDLRRQLQSMIKDGKSDEQIVDYMVTRYGDFVLYRPRFQSKTVALWLGPLVFLGVGLLTVAGIVLSRRRKLGLPADTLTESEAEVLERLFKTEQEANGNNPKQQ